MIPVLILVYLLALIAYGAWHSRQIRTQEDFAVAGRRLSAPVLVGTMLATWIGTGSIIGNAEKTYRVGIAMTLMPLGGAVGLFILSRVAARIRAFEQLTVQDILEARFGLAARVLGTIAIISAYLTIVSYQYRAGGAVIHTMFPELAEWCNRTFDGLNTYLRSHTAWNDASWGSVIAAVFIIGYTVLGGLVSVAYTDVINGIVMILGIAVGLPVLLADVGGIAGIERVFADTPEKLQLIGPIGWIAAINLILPAMLLVMGEANLYQRFFAARSARAAGRAAIVLVFAVLAVEVLIILFAFVASAVEPDLPRERHGHVILIAAMHYLPWFLAAAVLSAVVAIIVSTADSFLLVSANSVVRDVYHRFVAPSAMPERLVFASRLAVVGLGLVAFFVSVYSAEFLAVALWAYTMYGASITPALLAAFFWKRANASGAAAGMLAGIVMTVVWEKLDKSAWSVGWLAELDAVLPAMFASIVLLVGVSLLTPPPRREQLIFHSDESAPSSVKT
ncbi:MAG: sodium:solute symporter family protein [Planctomycetota bacterium]|nr:MAG: sodium:solute symporter family protein [Planctomycetota bacterium]